MYSREFKFFFVGRTVSLLGTSLSPVALTFGILEQSGGTKALGVILSAEMIPIIVFAIVGGGIADSFNRSRVLVFSNVISGIMQCIIGYLILKYYSVYAIIPCAIINGICQAIARPALRSIIPQLVNQSQVLRANSLVSMVRNIAKILGPTLAGILVINFNGSVALFIDGVTFFISAGMMASLGKISTEKNPDVTFIKDLKSGWEYYSQHSWIWSMTIAFTVTNVVEQGAWQILGPVIALRSFGADSWGLILGCNAIGVVAISLLLTKHSKDKSLVKAIIFLSFGSLPLFGLGLTSTVWVLAILATIAGVCTGYFDIIWDTTLQKKIPNNILSRVTSYQDAGSFIGIPIAQITTLPLTLLVGTTVSAVGGGIGFILAALAPLVLHKQCEETSLRN